MSDGFSDKSGCVIRVDRRTRINVLIGLCLVLGVYLLGLLLSLSGVIRNRNPLGLRVGLIVAAGVLFGMRIFTLFRSRVVLHPDYIEVRRELSGVRRVAVSDIVAYRHSTGGRGWPYYILLTRKGEVKLPPCLEHSAELQGLLEKLPLEPKEE